MISFLNKYGWKRMEEPYKRLDKVSWKNAKDYLIFTMKDAYSLGM